MKRAPCASMQGRLPHIICRAVLGRCGGSRGFRRTSVQPGSWTERKVVSGRRAGRPVWTALIASTGLKALSIRTTGDDISSLAGPRRCGGEFGSCGDGGMPHFRLCSKLRSRPRLLRCFRTERNDVSCAHLGEIKMHSVKGLWGLGLRALNPES